MLHYTKAVLSSIEKGNDMSSVLMILASLAITFLGLAVVRWLLCCSPPAKKAMKAQDERDRLGRGMSGL